MVTVEIIIVVVDPKVVVNVEPVVNVKAVVALKVEGRLLTQVKQEPVSNVTRLDLLNGIAEPKISSKIIKSWKLITNLMNRW